MKLLHRQHNGRSLDGMVDGIGTIVQTPCHHCAGHDPPAAPVMLILSMAFLLACQLAPAAELLSLSGAKVGRQSRQRALVYSDQCNRIYVAVGRFGAES